MDKHFETVSVHDEAIDRTATSREKLVEFGGTVAAPGSRDLSLIVFRNDVKPCRFSLGEISHKNMRGWVAGAHNDHERCVRAFQCAVKGVTSMPQEDGTRVDTWSPPLDDSGAMLDESLERFSHVVLAEIGAVAFRRSFFGRTIRHGFVLPPMSVVLLDEQTALHAAANRS